ncbi:MAG: hypothetical protein ABIN97_15780 [Ginsengibacter sp.]
MKFIFFIFLFFVGTISKADTIDYWHVYYNTTMIGDFNDYGENKIIIKRTELKAEDSIKVTFFSDTRSDDMPAILAILNVTDSKGKTIFNIFGSKPNISFVFPVKYFIRFSNGDHFIVTYNDAKNGKDFKVKLFEVKLE